MLSSGNRPFYTFRRTEIRTPGPRPLAEPPASEAIPTP